MQYFIVRTIAGFLAFGGTGAGAADSTNVYVAYGAHGVPRFANQAYDATYQLFLAAETSGFVNNEISPKRHLLKRISTQKEIAHQIQVAASKYGVDPALIHALIDRESGYDMKAVSRKGAVGAMQLLPTTARSYGAHTPSVTAQNIDAGTHYLRDLLHRFDGNLALSLAAYNAGEGSVARHGKNIPPFKETMLYVPAILTRFEEYKKVMVVQN